MRSSANSGFDFDVSAYPALRAASGLFVTGTDTDIGKTVVAGAIVRSLRLSGRPVEVFKPVASDCRRNARGRLVSRDTEFLAACADAQRSLADITPVCLREALAPNVAAARADQTIDLQAVFDAWNRLAESGRPIIVEGVGGLLCPITDEFWVIHLAKLCKLPVVVVSRPNLGTINHTLLTLHVARSAGLSVAGVVINRYPTDPEPVDVPSATNPEQIAQRGDVEVLVCVPNDAETDVATATVGMQTQAAIDQVDWQRLIGGGD